MRVRKQSLIKVMLVTVVAIMLLITAWAGFNDGPSSTDTVESVAQLVAELRNNGQQVTVQDTVSQPFFVPEGQVIRLNGHEVQVFEFPTAEAAESAVETIAPDGTSVGTSMVTWVATPHFYRAGKLVVLYVGEEQAVTSTLETILGPQIAGG